MKNIINYVCSVSASLLILIFLEGLLTGGIAFKFELYTIVGWVAQIVITIFSISLAIIITQNDLADKKRKTRSF
jgi:NAD/NADP transhydrogenase alpha subunit